MKYTAMLIGQVVLAVWRHPANRRRRVRSLLKAIGWQLSKRLKGSEIVVSSYGVKLALPTRRNSVSDLHYFGEYFEWESLKFCERLLRRGDVIVDGGANIGMFTYAVMAYTFHDAKVYAFEPDYCAAEVIRRNAKRNYAQGGVVVVEAALGSIPGIASFRNDLDVGSRLATDEEITLGGGVSVHVRTLDDVVPDESFVVLVKLDVEGSELDALRGAYNLLTTGRVGVILIEGLERQLALRGTTRRALFDFLASQGFSLWRYDVANNRLYTAAIEQEKPDVIAIHAEFVAQVTCRLTLPEMEIH